jgi:hypothetical protein
MVFPPGIGMPGKVRQRDPQLHPVQQRWMCHGGVFGVRDLSAGRHQPELPWADQLAAANRSQWKITSETANCKGPRRYARFA